MNIKPIKNEADYDAALAEVADLRPSRRRRASAA